MKYKVIRYFKDAKDNNRAYKVGDVYPRPGLEVKEERLEELLTNKNRRGTPMIVEEEPEDPGWSMFGDSLEAKKTMPDEAPKPKRRKKKNAD